MEVIDTPEGIQAFHVLQLIHGLSLEINNPGMRVSSRGSVMKVAKAKCGSRTNTKARVLADLIVWFRAEHNPEYTPSGRVKLALETLPERQLTQKRRAALGL